jgi:hypothetical protein
MLPEETGAGKEMNAEKNCAAGRSKNLLGISIVATMVLLGVTLMALETRAQTNERKREPQLECRLTVERDVLKIGEVLVGRIELKNTSAASVRVEWYSDPKEYLSILVKDEEGRAVPTSPYGAQFSPVSPAPRVLELRAGETYSSTVSPLGTVTKQKLTPGVYKVQALFAYKDLRASSAVVEIRLVD